jgi:putative phosphoribosyl transferase
MYFKDRCQAGDILTAQLTSSYKGPECVMVALGDGASLVSERMASALGCPQMLLLAENIPVPGEGVDFGSVSQGGSFVYNSEISTSEISYYTGEFNGYLQDQKREAFQRLNRISGKDGTVDYDLLQDKNVVLVSDGLYNSTVLDVAIDLLKPVRIKKLIIATPIASAEVVNAVHRIADELIILDVKSNFLATNHYYEDNTIPPREDIVAKVEQALRVFKGN